MINAQFQDKGAGKVLLLCGCSEVLAKICFGITG
jgi:hypothetical protein